MGDRGRVAKAAGHLATATVALRRSWRHVMQVDCRVGAAKGQPLPIWRELGLREPPGMRRRGLAAE
eukprot:scaffold2621_cov31-Tisochrysis_lutea.AAC.4